MIDVMGFVLFMTGCLLLVMFMDGIKRAESAEQQIEELTRDLIAENRRSAEAEQREAALVGLLETQTMFACRKGDEAITPVACDTHYSAWQPWGECYYVEQIHIALAASRAARGPRP